MDLQKIKKDYPKAWDKLSEWITNKIQDDAKNNRAFSYMPLEIWELQDEDHNDLRIFYDFFDEYKIDAFAMSHYNFLVLNMERKESEVSSWTKSFEILENKLS